jgi:hypothetical protein
VVNEKAPAVLDRMWDEVPVRPLPLEDLLRAGRAAKRPARRAPLVAAAAATALVLGGGTLAVQALVGGPTAAPDHSSGGAVDAPVPGRCTADDLGVRALRPGGAQTGHALSLLELRNTSGGTCVLTGYPERVTFTEPGRPTVEARKGSWFPMGAARPVVPGGVTMLGIETVSVCPSRAAGTPLGPAYHHLHVRIGGSVLTIRVPGGLDVGCTPHVTRFGHWHG